MPKREESKDGVASKRDEVIRRMIATPPKAHKEEPKRRPAATPIGRLIKDADEKRKRDKA